MAELHRRNTGRDPFPLLLSRRQLPKTPNVPPVGGRPLSPRTKRRMNIQYYDWKDMRIGSVVKVCRCCMELGVGLLGRQGRLAGAPGP